jgi:hypothetical protein
MLDEGAPACRTCIHRQQLTPRAEASSTASSVQPTLVDSTKGTSSTFPLGTRGLLRSILANELTERIYGTMDEATWTYPSHGEDTTPEAERRNLGSGAPADW